MMTTPEVARLFGLPFYRVDYWVRSGLVTPTVEASGTGSRRGWSVRDAIKVGIIAEMVNAGVSTQRVRDVVEGFDVGDWFGIVDAEERVGVLMQSGMVWVDVPAIRERVERFTQLGLPMDSEGGGGAE